MLIQVHYKDNRFDYVKDTALHTLVKSGAIERFRRSSGWVKIGSDPIRQFQRKSGETTEEPAHSIVRVAYGNNTYDYVNEQTLNDLIESNRIIKFKRITGWVTLGVDTLRNKNRDHTFRYPSEIKKIRRNKT